MCSLGTETTTYKIIKPQVIHMPAETAKAKRILMCVIRITAEQLLNFQNRLLFLISTFGLEERMVYTIRVVLAYYLSVVWVTHDMVPKMTNIMSTTNFDKVQSILSLK